MNLNLITTTNERRKVERMVDAYGEYVRGNISRDQWDEFPRETWLDCVGASEYPFVVYDNQEGMCFVEGFKSIDGAVLYASGAKLTCEDASEWDNKGTLDVCDLVLKVEEEENAREALTYDMMNN